MSTNLDLKPNSLVSDMYNFRFLGANSEFDLGSYSLRRGFVATLFGDVVKISDLQNLIEDSTAKKNLPSW